MEQEYIKGDIVMYDNKIHTLGVNNYEFVEHQLELSGVTPEILEKNGWEKVKKLLLKHSFIIERKV